MFLDDSFSRFTGFAHLLLIIKIALDAFLHIV